MQKIKLTKGELKKQRDALRQYRRYLPTLQLKKQQLQMEILRWQAELGRKQEFLSGREQDCLVWAGLLAESGSRFNREWITPSAVETDSKNIAGVELPVFLSASFPPAEYDLFVAPVWFDKGVDALREITSLRRECAVMARALELLRHELRITTQRVNLFEKVKIPQALDAIRRIKIYIGDQMANAVGRSKIAKHKIEALEFVEEPA
jgi:V/A-type H+-transporting ATPase subunit D